MMRLAMTRDGSGGCDVPVAIRLYSPEEEEEEEGGWKNRAGTDPHVRGAMNVAMAV